MGMRNSISKDTLNIIHLYLSSNEKERLECHAMHGLKEKTLAVRYSHVDCLRLKKHYISVWLTQWQIRVGTIINKTPNRHCTMYVDAWVCWIRYQIESFYSENQQLNRVKKRFKVLLIFWNTYTHSSRKSLHFEEQPCTKGSIVVVL